MDSSSSDDMQLSDPAIRRPPSRRKLTNWSAKEKVLERFLSLDGRFLLFNNAPLALRCILAQAIGFGIIGSLSYLIGACIRRDDLSRNSIAIFTGGILVGAANGACLYVFPSFSFSRSTRSIAQSLFLEVFLSSTITFVSIPAVGAYLLGIPNEWQNMLVDQFIGVGFVLINLVLLGIALRLMLRRSSSRESDPSTSSSLLSEDAHEDGTVSLEMNPIVSSPVRNGDDNVQRRRSPTNRSLPFLRPPEATKLADLPGHSHEDTLFLDRREDETMPEMKTTGEM
jgi:hypothetical protein